MDSDQYESVGDATLQPVILTSMLKRVDVAVFETLEKFSKDEEIPAVTTFGLENDGVGYSTSGGAIEDIVAQLEELKQAAAQQLPPGTLEAEILEVAHTDAHTERLPVEVSQ